MRFFKSPRFLAAVVILGGVLGLALWPETIEIDLGRVSRGPMQVTIDEEGETRVRERFVVSAPVAGRLQRIALEPGDRVERGRTVVARITSAPAPLIDVRTQAELAAAIEAAQAAVGQTRADRERAQAALTRARSNARRLEPLAKAGAVSADELEVAQTSLRTAEETARAGDFVVARAEHELTLARARLSPSNADGRSVDIVAPVSGVVLRRIRESETVVPPGDALLEIGDPSSLEIVADFLSTDAVRVRPGADALIEQWGGAAPLQARVRRIDPSGFMKVSALGVEEQRVNVILDLTGADAVAARLGDGFRVEVRVVVWREASVLNVPLGSVFRRGEEWAVFVVEGGHVRLQPVKMGQRNASDAEITEGLSEGQSVVLHPPDTLVDGARVAARRSDQ